MPTVSINNRQLYYQDIGQGFPLVFGHSYLCDHQSWQYQVEQLSSSFRCIVPDLWGHGASDALPTASSENKDTDEGERYSIQQLADDYWQFTQQLNLQQFALIGLSVGAMWSVQLTLDHPDAVRALVFMDSFVGEEAKATQNQYLAMLDVVEQVGAIPAAMIEQLCPLFFSPETLAKQDRPQVEQFKQSLATIGEKNIATVVTLGRSIFTRASLLDRLGEIHCPTLVLVGEHDVPRPGADFS